MRMSNVCYQCIQNVLIELSLRRSFIFFSILTAECYASLPQIVLWMAQSTGTHGINGEQNECPFTWLKSIFNLCDHFYWSISLTYVYQTSSSAAGSHHNDKHTEFSCIQHQTCKCLLMEWQTRNRWICRTVREMSILNIFHGKWKNYLTLLKTDRTKAI